MVTIPAEEVSSLQVGMGAGGAGSYVLAVPMDPRIPKIRIKTRQLAQVRRGVAEGVRRDVDVGLRNRSPTIPSVSLLFVWFEIIFGSGVACRTDG